MQQFRRMNCCKEMLCCFWRGIFLLGQLFLNIQHINLFIFCQRLLIFQSVHIRNIRFQLSEYQSVRQLRPGNQLVHKTDPHAFMKKLGHTGSASLIYNMALRLWMKTGASDAAFARPGVNLMRSIYPEIFRKILKCTVRKKDWPRPLCLMP